MFTLRIVAAIVLPRVDTKYAEINTMFSALIACYKLIHTEFNFVYSMY